MRVLVFEKEQHGSGEGSPRSMGSLRVQGRQEPELPLAVDAMTMWKDWASRYEFEFVQGGNMYVAESTSELKVIREYEAQAHRMGLDAVRVLEPSEAERLVPFRAGSIAGVLYSPSDSHCDPRQALEMLGGLARERGAQFRYGECVTDLIERGGSIRGVVTRAGDAVGAEAVVVAGGVWTSKLTSSVGIRVPVKEVLSTQAETTAGPPTFRASLRGFNFSARQKPNGRLILGGGLDARVDKIVSFEDLNGLRVWLPRYLHNRRSVRLRLDLKKLLDESKTRGSSRGRDRAPMWQLRYPAPRGDGMDRSLRALQAKLPGLGEVHIDRLWCGFIDNTLDGLPVIELSARPEGLVTLAGFSGHGLGIAPIVGVIAADLVATGRSKYDLQPFRAGRFFEPGLSMPERFV
jgi:glycine/D-amino acid oxidase-like deaminating enzyme